jgi:hypothetical protein
MVLPQAGGRSSRFAAGRMTAVSEEFEWHGKPRRQVFAVLRVEREFLRADTPGEWAGEGLDGVVVQSVLPTPEDAQAEARRLNELNGEKGCAYYWLATRYYPEGRSRTAGRDR